MFTLFLKIYKLYTCTNYKTRLFFFRIFGVLYKKSYKLRHFSMDWEVSKRMTKKIFVVYLFLNYLVSLIAVLNFKKNTKIFSDWDFLKAFKIFVWWRFFVNETMPQYQFLHNIIYLKFFKVCFYEYPHDLFDKIKHFLIIIAGFVDFNLKKKKKK